MSAHTYHRPTNYFFLEEDDRNIAQTDRKLADDLTRYLLDEFTSELRYHRSARSRILAANKIASYGTHKYDVEVLLDASRVDENPNVRTAAKDFVEVLLNNLQ